METKLKPCPFPQCRGEAVEMWNSGQNYFSIYCLKCGCALPSGSLSLVELRDRWNTRHGEVPAPDTDTDRRPFVQLWYGDNCRKIYYEEDDTVESINTSIADAFDEMNQGCEVTITLDDSAAEDPEPVL